MKERKGTIFYIHFTRGTSSSTYLDIYSLSEESEKLRDQVVCLNTINDLSLNIFKHNYLQGGLCIFYLESHTFKKLYHLDVSA